MNKAALTGAVSTVEVLVGGVKQLVADSVRRCKDRVLQQEESCLQGKENVLQLLVRHDRHLVFKSIGRKKLELSSESDLSSNQSNLSALKTCRYRVKLTAFVFCRRSINRTWRRFWWPVP